MRRLLIVPAVLLVLALPGSAAAGELTGTNGFYTYNDAASNQTNNLVVTRSGDALVLTDGAGITENSAECSQTVSTVATCTFAAGAEPRIAAHLAGGDDKADASGAGQTASTFEGGAGKDELTGSPRSATLRGGPDADSLTGGGGYDVIQGGEGDDDIFGLAGGDNLYGDEGADELHGGDDGDSLDGGAGPDLLSGGADAPFDPCGDTLDYDDATSPLRISLDGAANDDAGEGDTIAGDVESVEAGSGKDVLVGNDRVNCFASGAGDDTLEGLGAGDSLHGDGGADRIDGGDGDDELSGDGFDAADPGDVLVGGDGVDGVTFATLLCDQSFNCTPRELSITLDGVADDGAPGEGDNVGADVEDVRTFGGFYPLTGLPGSVHLTGGPQFNVLGTDAGADVVDPAGGSDSVTTVAGDDTIHARDGFADRLDCGEGTDTANVDQLDTVKDCETVNREPVPLDVPADDRPPHGHARRAGDHRSQRAHDAARRGGG